MADCLFLVFRPRLKQIIYNPFNSNQMKIVKFLLIMFGSVFALFLIYAYLQDREVSVSRSIVVHAPVDAVYNNVVDLNKRMLWSPWKQLDTTMHITLGDITKGKGASYSWTSTQSGNGKLIYSEVVPGEKIVSELHFGEGQDASKGIFEFTPVEDGTKVTWTFKGDMGNNPFMRVMGRFMEDMLGPTFEQGLNGLKEQVENSEGRAPATEMSFYVSQVDKQEVFDDVEIRTVTLAPFHYISVMDSCSMQEMNAHIGASYQKLGRYAGEHKAEPAGAPIIFYHSYNPPEKIVFEPAFILNTSVEPSAKVNAATTPAMKALLAVHYGSYETSDKEWNALDAYVKEKGLEPAGNPWEEYITGPESQSDTALWETRIYYPVK